MFGQIVAFLAVATSVAFASTCGYCYPGYGSNCGTSGFLNGGLYNNGLYGSRILNTGCAIPPFVCTVGAPEVVTSCENSFISPVFSTGTVSSNLYESGCYGCGSTLGGCGTGLIAAAC